MLSFAAIGKRQTSATYPKQWVTLFFRNTKVLHQSFTPNNRFKT